MKAIFFEKHGEIDTLKYADLPQPEPKPGEALVTLSAEVTRLAAPGCVLILSGITELM